MCPFCHVKDVQSPCPHCHTAWGDIRNIEWKPKHSGQSYIDNRKYNNTMWSNSTDNTFRVYEEER